LTGVQIGKKTEAIAVFFEVGGVPGLLPCRKGCSLDNLTADGGKSVLGIATFHERVERASRQRVYDMAAAAFAGDAAAPV